MKRINSRQKGARGERAAAAYLTSLGFPCTRSARNGVDGGEDLIFDPPLPLVVEVKRDKSIWLGTKALADAYSQAFSRAPVFHRAFVLWRPNNRKWALSWCHGVLVTASGDDDIKYAIHDAISSSEAAKAQNALAGLRKAVNQ